MKNKNLHVAKKKQDDEFYTLLSDIETGLAEYRKHFKGKVVYCNCDDPAVSNFYKYFHDNFEALKLKGLIVTYYNPVDLFSFDKYEAPTVTEYDGRRVSVRKLKGDGDFRSDECRGLLKRCDVVVTNPPFSLFRQYFQQLVDYKKDFFVVAPLNCLDYKCVFPFMKNRRLFIGVGRLSNFTKRDGSFIGDCNCIWLSTFEGDEKEPLELVKSYYGNEGDYPKFDNYNAINVEKTVDIPKDYDGYMGVPISFLEKLDYRQFDIIGATRSWEKNTAIKPLPNSDKAILKGRAIFTRIIIRKKTNKIQKKNRN